jgi:hypothetical protein
MKLIVSVAEGHSNQSIKALKESIRLKDSHTQSIEVEKQRLIGENAQLNQQIKQLTEQNFQKDLQLRECHYSNSSVRKEFLFCFLTFSRHIPEMKN